MRSTKISVVVTAYNHEKYIGQCLDGILQQKGSFVLEVILGDDCSADRTRQIMHDYCEKFPGTFVLLPATKNMGIHNNIKRCLAACSGDYIAFCEGDDYWTDTHKLAKQAEFLESHPDYSLCFNAVIVYCQNENRYEPFAEQLSLEKDTLTTEDLVEYNYIGNLSTCMYRTSIIRQLPEEIYNRFLADWVLNMACGRMGKIGFIRDWMSVYRRHSKGLWSGAEPIDKSRTLSAAIDSYNQLFCYDYDKQFRKQKEILEKCIAQYEKQLQVQGRARQVYLVKLCGSLLIRGIRHPKKAYNRLRTIIRNAAIEVNWQPTTNREADLLVLDNAFPHPLSRFRLEEFCSYLAYFENSMVLSTGTDLPGLQQTEGLDTIIHEFEGTHPEFKFRTQVTTYHIHNYTAKLAYCTFLIQAFWFLEALEKKRIPFVFTLYPGGGFGIDQDNSNRMLRRVLGSAQFRKVIVTQTITYEYLVKNHFCTKDKIEFIYGGVMPFDVLTKCNDYDKRFYGFEKHTLDICFVAYKNIPRGVDKGYDVFVEVAKKLAQVHSNIRFHVVGNFNEADIPIDGLEGKITFYGLQTLEWFDSYYMDKDIILSPNTPFVLNTGFFDGFPTGSCVEAGLRKVALFCTDELKLNNYFVDGEEIVIIPHDCDRIVKIIETYYNAPDKLRSMGEKGAAKLQEVFSYENQMLPRIRIIENEIRRESEGKDRG